MQFFPEAARHIHEGKVAVLHPVIGLALKTKILYLWIWVCGINSISAQSSSTTDQVIEGGKIIVELVKAISSKKESEKDQGCRGNYADLCIENSSVNSITVNFEHRITAEKRELVILPQGKECFLRAKIGVWTYDLRVTGISQSIRKGDVLIEGCNNMVMNIK